MLVADIGLPGFVLIVAGIGIFFIVIVSFVGMDTEVDKIKQMGAEAMERVVAAGIVEKQALSEYSDEFEQRKLTIGTIKCSQCEWSGQWGTGMTYNQFFAELNDNYGFAGDYIVKLNKENPSPDNRQYTCPVCNSSGWQKA